MIEILREKTKILSRIRVWNIVPFVVWPLLFLVAFFIMYNRMVALYIDEIEYKGNATADAISVNFLMYLNNIDDALKSSVSLTEYMMDKGVGDEEILDYITYETEKLGVVSATGSRGIFGVFKGKFLHGLGWKPGADYIPMERIWYTEALAKKGRYTFVGPYPSQRADEYCVTATKLLDDGESVICFSIDYDTFKKMTTGFADADASMTVLAMNEEGYVLASSSSCEIGEDYATSDDPLKKGIYDAIKNSGGKGTFSLDSVSGHDNSYIISRRHVMYDLYVVTITDASVVLESLNNAALIFGIIFVSGMLIILILNFRTLSKDLEDKKHTENLNSIANIYGSMYRIDMTHDSYEMMLSRDYREKKLIGDKKLTATALMKTVAPQMVDERSKEIIEEFTDLSTLDERMRYVDTITVEYLTYDHIWQRGRFIVVDRDSDKKLMDVLFVTEIIDDEKRARERLRYLAETDRLTGINNRGSGQEKISDLLTKNVGGMFIMFDVDRFKYINDTFGHDTGDKVLAEIAETMKHTFREKDVLMRLGGDEYAAYMPGVFGIDSGEPILKRFIDAIKQIDVSDVQNYEINISIGAAFYYPTDTFSFDELYKRADSCTYESKKASGSKVTFYKRMDRDQITGF